jgi:hypothetical protein
MGMRTGMNAPAVLIDKYINSAYDIVKTVADAIDDVATVAGLVNEPEPSRLTIVAGLAEEIIALAEHPEGIQWLASPEGVTTVTSLYNDKAKLDSIFADKSKLDSIYADKSKLDSLYADKAKLDRLFTSIGNIDRVYTSIDKVDDVADSIVAVDYVYDNIQPKKIYRLLLGFQEDLQTEGFTGFEC